MDCPRCRHGNASGTHSCSECGAALGLTCPICARVSVLNWNEPAMRFYRSLGAERADDDVTFRLRGSALDRIAGEDS
jgi:hypothetical protein